jgi:hypothetical protein
VIATLEGDPRGEALNRSLDDYRRVFAEAAMEFLEESE